jgi:predicted nucleotidyltransferase
MSASVAIDLPYDEIAAICRKHEVAELAIFGSAVNGEFGPESDYDFLVVFKYPERTGSLPSLMCSSRWKPSWGGRLISSRSAVSSH